MDPVISLNNISKIYNGGFQALNNVSLDINRSEIFALLGPNGAGKTTLISSICGTIVPSSGTIKVENLDITKHFRQTRKLIGLVPQELTLDAFMSVYETINYSRGLYGKAADNSYIDYLLNKLSLWEKRKEQLQKLSGGMRRRVLIAKALAHQPKILFLDEPTAGVDVELRKSMWELISELRNDGMTIILTTHYIEEAELMADRIGVMQNGQLILLEEKRKLINRMGRKQLIVSLEKPLSVIPEQLSEFNLELGDDNNSFVYTYDANAKHKGITLLIQKLAELNIKYRDLQTKQSSLEDIFVDLVATKPKEEQSR